MCKSKGDNEEQKRKYEKVSDKEKEMLRKHNISIDRFYQRVHGGMSRLEASTKPVRRKKKITESDFRLMKERGISYGNFRVKRSREAKKKE